MSRYDAEPSSPQESSRTVVVVLLSLLILAVIGALFGYVLGTRDIDADKSLSGDGQSAGPASAGATPGEQCPGFIGKAVSAKDSKASMPLYLVLYIRTRKNREAWICREADKTGLWYQGHDRKNKFYDDGETPVEGENGLLLGGVLKKGPNSYEATNGDTTYRVTLQFLQIDRRGQQTDTDVKIQARAYD